ncbi:hypothetical protein EVAR_34264_1 [Eumeta japonica]|uniref:Uncharacterized protein n=1 Tax=Eumeta variegata TaxID=151549 RepID=A0A4C1VW03_EUMVA|nr:hypothetical protein EVAR_34264_1 [Eumeta japonica]
MTHAKRTRADEFRSNSPPTIEIKTFDFPKSLMSAVRFVRSSTGDKEARLAKDARHCPASLLRYAGSTMSNTQSICIPRDSLEASSRHKNERSNLIIDMPHPAYVPEMEYECRGPGIPNHGPSCHGWTAHLYRLKPHRNQSRCDPDRMAGLRYSTRHSNSISSARSSNRLKSLGATSLRSLWKARLCAYFGLERMSESWKTSMPTRQVGRSHQEDGSGLRQISAITREKGMTSQMAQTFTGHGGFVQYLFNFKLRGSPHCACDPVKIQYVQHVLKERNMFLRELVALEAEIDVRVARRHFPEIMEDKSKREKSLKFCSMVVERCC